MAKQKQHVFSARTTEEGLRLLNDLRKERNIGWDELVVDAVCAHYGLDKGTMALPRKEKTARGPEKAAERRKAGGRKKGKGAAAGLKAKSAESKA
jgi:hypothetical protein